jgi:hypothetical protein
MAPGKRKKYSEEALEQAVRAVEDDGMSFRQASEEYGVPHTTIRDRVKGLHGPSMGQPTVLTSVEEEMICDYAKMLAEWGFPFTGEDLRHFVKAYLDKKGVSGNRFNDNLPTHRWVATFLSRHKDLSLRKSNSIKRSRAAVSREDVYKFFGHFLKSVEGVDPANLFNFDETCIKDDMRLQKGICKKGVKYFETVVNTTKQEC